ncbi:MAG: hypothetical protein ABI334_05660 [Candidatus Dormiibacterota bacterium]
MTVFLRGVAAAAVFRFRRFAGAGVSARWTRRWMVRRLRSTAPLVALDPCSVNLTT